VKAALFVLAAVGLISTAANAFPTMIRHGYTGCAACHTDPSGGTLLTEYGRAQSELLLSTRWGAAKEAEPSAASKFLLGAVSPPEALTLGGWVGAAGLHLERGRRQAGRRPRAADAHLPCRGAAPRPAARGGRARLRQRQVGAHTPEFTTGRCGDRLCQRGVRER